jgi:AcrR family transcriptional regulator
MLARPRLDGARRRSVDARREQLLHLGLELFCRRSYELISIDDIAGAAEISRSLLYHYFRNKRGFYVECVRFAATQLRETVNPDPRPDPGLEPRARLRQGLEAYLDYVARFANAYVTVMRSGIGYDEEVREIVEGTRTAIIGDILRDLGRFADHHMVRVGLRGWIGMVEYACLEWLERRSVDKRELMDVLVAALETTLASATGMSVDEMLAQA